MKNKLNSSRTLSYLILGLFIGIFLFVRSFMGIYIFNFRLGELGVLFCFLLTGFYVLFIYKKKLIDKSIELNYLLIILSFFLVLLFSDSNILILIVINQVLYMDDVFHDFGCYLYSNNNFDDILFKFFRFLLPLIYCFLVLIPNGIKEFFMEFFGTYSDKFEMHKGSDILIMYVIVFMINNRKLKENDLNIYFLLAFLHYSYPFLCLRAGQHLLLQLDFIIEVLRNRKVLFSKKEKRL